MLLGSYDNKALSKMVATAKAKGESGIMSTPPKVNAEIDLENHNRIETDIDRKIQNIVKHTVNNNFTSDTVNACAPMSNQYQAFLARYADIGTLKVGDINQKMVGKMISKCKNMNNTTTKIISDITSKLGIKTVDTVKTKVEATMESTAESVTIGKGLGVASSGSCLLLLMVSGGAALLKMKSKKKGGGGGNNNIYIIYILLFLIMVKFLF